MVKWMHLSAISLPLIILALLGSGACTSISASETPRQSSPGPTALQTQPPQPTYASTIIPTLTPSPIVINSTPWISATAPITTTSSELILSQDISKNPPPPSELLAVWNATGVQLSWDLPPAVRVPHIYSDEVQFYKIYRHTEGTQVTFLAQTAQLTYLDRSVAAGTKYYYTVSAIHAGGVESLRAVEVSAP